jgi:putative molybdenum carrier protein
MDSQIPKIVSGGQTGADRAALDRALSRGIECGGWCPKGRKAEEVPIPSKYPLVETPSSNYVQRTEWNVRDTDGTVIISIAEILPGGSKKTLEFAQKHIECGAFTGWRAERPGKAER